MGITGQSVVASVALFVAMLAGLEVGRRIRRRRPHDEAAGGGGAVEGAVFGLLGLLIAFTFTGAAARFDVRRHQILEEANAVGTAWLRLALLPPEDQPPLRDAVRAYVDARIALHEKLPDVAAATVELDRATALQQHVWSIATASLLAHEPRHGVTELVLGSLNQMFDVGTSRVAAARTHVPTVILALLFVFAVLASVLAGYGMAARRQRAWLHAATFAVVVALTFYVILDLEYPRAGVIRLDGADRVLLDVRAGMS